jgi:LuxR family maltose regulon positive regulatory protein
LQRGVFLGRVVLARAALANGDREAAGRQLELARPLARAYPEAVRLVAMFHEASAGYDRGAPPPAEVPGLTGAELRVLELLPSHLTRQEIGDRLCISRNTTKKHLAAIYRKLDTGSRSATVEEARRLGLLPAEAPDLSGHPAEHG